MAITGAVGAGPKLSARIVGVGAAAALLMMAAACGSDNRPELVTTTSRVTATTAPPLTTTTAPPLTTTTRTSSTTAEGSVSTAAPAPDTPEAEQILYRVVRQESTRDGSRLFLAIPPGAYSDVDLANLVLSVHEERDDLFEVHIFDSREAVEALIKPATERTPEESELLERHYLVSLLEGSILRFQGPFADLEGYIIGS